MSGKSQRYSKELKLKAVKMYMQDGLSAMLHYTKKKVKQPSMKKHEEK